MLDRKILTEVYRFWFGEPKGPADMPKDKAELWFTAKPEFDELIRERFEQYLKPAKATDWNLADLTREEQVGLVVLLDQFPRNIYRTSGDAYAYDDKALAIARELLKDGPARFYPFERTFVSLPFMHSENIVDQDYSVAFVANQLVGVPVEAREAGIRNGFDFAYKHWMIVRKFGRFPHRNLMMGRETTPEELEFLKSGRGF